MACRCTDIEEYEAELEVLNSISKEIENLSKSQVTVDNGLTELQGFYSATLNATEGFIAGFHKLDSGAAEAVSSMKTETEEAISKLSEMLEQAREEDKAWDHSGT